MYLYNEYFFAPLLSTDTIICHVINRIGPNYDTGDTSKTTLKTSILQDAEYLLPAPCSRDVDVTENSYPFPSRG